MIALDNLTLTSLWHDAHLESMQFVWAMNGAITAICTTMLNPEEDTRLLRALGLTTRHLIVYFREVDDVHTLLNDNYAAMPAIDDWSASISAATSGVQQHSITTMSGCQFRFQCQRVELQAYVAS